jgi:hypothetical protein
VLAFLLIPIPLFKELFMDSTGDVVIALNDIDIWRLCQFLGVLVSSLSNPQKSNRLFVFQKKSRNNSTLRNGGCALPKFVQL